LVLLSCADLIGAWAQHPDTYLAVRILVATPLRRLNPVSLIEAPPPLDFIS